MSNIASSKRCQSVSALGRRCRERRSPAHPTLCPLHARQQQEREQKLREIESAAVATDLIGPVQEFYSAITLTHVTGNLLLLAASDRIPPRKAAVLAYICQLILQSQREAKIEINAPPAALAPLIRKAYAPGIAKSRAEDPSFWEDLPAAPASPSSATAASPSPGTAAVCDSISGSSSNAGADPCRNTSPAKN